MLKTLHQEIWIQAEPAALAQAIFRVERFAEFLEDVKGVEILKRSSEEQISSWRVELDGVELRWIEEDRLLPAENLMKYRVLEGDFERFEGEWSFGGEENSSAGTRVTLTIGYDLGLPAFEELIGEILEIKVRKNARSLLEALKERVERGGG